jgi:hypothetical protein
MESSPRRPSSTMRIFSSAPYCFRVARRKATMATLQIQDRWREKSRQSRGGERAGGAPCGGRTKRRARFHGCALRLVGRTAVAVLCATGPRGSTVSFGGAVCGRSRQHGSRCRPAAFSAAIAAAAFSACCWPASPASAPMDRREDYWLIVAYQRSEDERNRRRRRSSRISAP